MHTCNELVILFHTFNFFFLELRLHTAGNFCVQKRIRWWGVIKGLKNDRLNIRLGVWEKWINLDIWEWTYQEIDIWIIRWTMEQMMSKRWMVHSPICSCRGWVLTPGITLQIAAYQIHFILASWVLLYLLFKLCMEPASTTSPPRLFYFLNTLRLKKYFLKSLWSICVFNFQLCPWVSISCLLSSLSLSTLTIFLEYIVCYHISPGSSILKCFD